MYVARDRDGSLYLYGFKPERREIDGTWYDWDNGSHYGIIELDRNLFSQLSWEDEPREVELVSKEFLNSWKESNKHILKWIM